ncbi:MAG: membrane-bound O-acyltransferase family protein [Spongiibacteraceae bacterium]|nr:membrane-bound O-acyltransferase family protein [Spongiibacteraceae bacterium]
MLFNSLEFALFLPLVFALYWLIPRHYISSQNLLILCASYGFYAWWDWRFLGLILLSSTADYAVGLALSRSEKPAPRRCWLALSLIVNLGLLGFFKYYNFFVDSLVTAFHGIGVELSPASLSIVLPVGISFYTFQTLSYTLDVYHRKLKPERNAIAFFAYVSFFPQLVAGPIERARHLLPQFKRARQFTYEQGREGLQLIAQGFFKKVVIADNCAPYVDAVFSNYQTASAPTLALGTILFGFQIYGDFSGYSDMARGIARLFGMDLMLNFRRPFFAQNPAEFWNRWHISLSSWFRDYVYIPLGGSRHGKFTTYRNLLTIFLISGLWHGAHEIYLLWGLIHGINVVAYTAIRNSIGTAHGPFRYPLFNIAITYVITCLTWIFFRSSSIDSAMEYLSRLLSTSWLVQAEPVPLLLMYAIGALLLYETTQERPDSALSRTLRAPFKFAPVRWCAYLAIFSSAMLGGGDTQQFIYFQF